MNFTSSHIYKKREYLKKRRQPMVVGFWGGVIEFPQGLYYIVDIKADNM